MEASSNLYFVFSIRESLYAVDALAVNVTFSLPSITTMEEAPAFIAGVINLRGSIIPVLDLGLLFGRSHQDRNLSDAVLVLHDRGRMVGVIVNEVLDVVPISTTQIDHPPRLENPLRKSPTLILGMARVDEKIINIIDHDALISLKESLSLEWSEALASEQNKLSEHTSEISEAERRIYQKRARDLMRQVEADTHSETLQLAVVLLGKEYFGMDIRYVNEFTKIKNIIPLPNCPQHILGNMNLRGSILTVIDIRLTLGMYTENFSYAAKIVVSSAADILVGVAVDDIDDIVPINPKDIAPLPSSTNPDVLRYAVGTATYNQKAMTILNLPEILKNKELVVNER